MCIRDRCNLSGRFIFYIPGIRSLDAFELHTNSFYALSRAIERFEAIAFMRGGRLAGFLDARRTPFYLTKTLREVSHLDAKTGQAVRSAHWIIELEAPVDVAALLAQQEEEATLRMADAAACALHGNELSVHAPAPTADRREEEAAGAPEAAGAGLSPMQESSPGATPAMTQAGAEPGTDAVYALATDLGVPRARLNAYLDWAWGAGWRRNAQGVKRVLAELARFQDDPAGLRARIDAEIGAQE